MSAKPKDELPGFARRVAETKQELWKAYEKLGQACTEAGPLTGTVLHCVKLALAIGGGSEGAVHSHARRARAAGVAPEAIRHVAYLAVTTLGFPRAVAALTWIEDVLSPSSDA
ncbi:MAG: carboxymuconolactone decarboxylase family protein [Alphaproteobacteria bacterium]|nr:carboxymuconolactone decarboxylase family protein [Alphaproteobacteria bacterium]